MKLPLYKFAAARSGDKGASANVGVIAREEQFYPLLREWLTPERVAAHFAALPVKGVKRYELPNLLALNFVLEGVLGEAAGGGGGGGGGGGAVSLRTDAQGKALGMGMLEMMVDVPAELAARLDKA